MNTEPATKHDPNEYATFREMNRDLLLEALSMTSDPIPPGPDQVAYWLGIDVDQARATLIEIEDEGYIDDSRGFRRFTEIAMLEFADRRTRARPLPTEPSTDQEIPT